MTHEEAREKLLDLAYGELEPAERLRVEQHLSGCPGCAAEMASLAGTRAAAQLLPDPGPPGGRAELVEAARRAAARQVERRRAAWSRSLAWTAVAAAFLAVGGVTMRWLDASPRHERGLEEVVGSAPADRAIESAPGAQRARPSAAPASTPAPGSTPAELQSPLASRERGATAGEPARAGKAKAASRDASAPAAEAKAESMEAVAGARPGPAKESPAFPPGTSGAFVSQDLRTGARFRVNPAGCAARYAPFSTFKIPSSLIGLETGEVKDPDERWRWDAARYPPPSPAPGGDYLLAWQQDQSLRTALARSIVWYFRELANRVGEPRMKQWLATFDYGNQDLTGGLDRFWLGRSLRISPDEQVEFLARLQGGQFPVARRNLDLVKEVLTQESGAGYRLIAKTGSSPDGEGWLVGWVESSGGGCAFALHLEGQSFDEMARLRPGLARDFLRQAGCIPP
jgi:beta-lactamase class D